MKTTLRIPSVNAAAMDERLRKENAKLNPGAEFVQLRDGSQWRWASGPQHWVCMRAPLAPTTSETGDWRLPQ